MSNFPETLGLGQIISRELKEEIERRYNTYVELERQLAKFNDTREAAYRLLEEKCDQLRQQLADARRTAEYWKAEHLAGNEQLGAVSEEFGLPKGIGPAPGEIKRILSDLRQQLAEHKKHVTLLRDVLSSYDGSHSIDQWDEDVMPSRDWNKKRKQALAATKEPK